MSDTGRPLVELTEEQIKEVQTLSSVLNTTQIADYLGVSHVTFKAIRDRDERVSFAYKNGKAKAIATIAGNLIKSAKSGNTAAQIFYLKTQAGWRDKVEEAGGAESVAEALNNLADKLPS